MGRESPEPSAGLAREGADPRARARALVREHESWRARCLNLIASENALSPSVRRALDSDLVQRYADYTGRDPGARRYRGTRYVELIEQQATELAREVFRASSVELRPISGHVAGAAVVMGLCRPGDIVLEVGRDGGGHREAGKLAGPPLVPLEVRHLPVDPARYNVDAEAAVRLIEEVRPRLVILGSSNFLFPHPVREIADALHRLPDATLVYDASHVLGLIAGGRFQDPLEEGADVVFGSTHKTLPGPQGGIIFSNRDDLMDRICEAVYPGLVTNHHAFRIPALTIALAEMRAWGAAYADRIVANGQALGEALNAHGVPTVQVDGRHTASHTLLLRVAGFGPADDCAAGLERCGIITTAATLPEALGTQGIRIGTQEITRMGAGEDAMRRVAGLIADALGGDRGPDLVAADVAALAGSLGPVRFTWPDA